MPLNIPAELEALGLFHGHLGPYVVIGYKMGLLARQKLGEGWMSAIVDTGLVKPLSCIIDGIQFSTHCTMGKGNIEVRDKGIPKVRFKRADKRFAVLLKDSWLKKLERETSKNNELELALQFYNAPDDELFEIGAVLDSID